MQRSTLANSSIQDSKFNLRKSNEWKMILVEFLEYTYNSIINIIVKYILLN